MNPRGSIVCPVRTKANPVPVGGAGATGRFPGIVVTLKSGSRDMTDRFHEFVRDHGLYAECVYESADGRSDAWEVLGSGSDESVGALSDLTDQRFVVRWQYIVNVRPPRGASGSGEMSANAERAIRRSKMHWPDRVAVEETERRAKLPAADRDRTNYRELKDIVTKNPAVGSVVCYAGRLHVVLESNAARVVVRERDNPAAPKVTVRY